MFTARIEYSEKAIRETAYINFRYVYLRFSIMALLGSIIIYLVEWLVTIDSNEATRQLTTVIAVIGIVFVIAVCIARPILYKRKYVNYLTDQIRTVYHKEYAEINCTIKEDAIDYEIPDSGVRTIFLNDINRVNETAHYISVRFKGNLQMAIIKESIEGGSVKELLDFLNERKHK